jgi:hypothetical protein
MAADWHQLHDEALEIVSGARDRDVTLRVVGGAGIRLHCGPLAEAMLRLGRSAKDLDFIVPKEDRRGMRRYLEARGYLVDRDLLVAMEGSRYSFSHPITEIEIDVFVERLAFNHTVEVRERLGGHPTTIPLEDLLMQKLQIVSLTNNDLLDMTVLLAIHPVLSGSGTAEDLDADYIAGLLAKDWGFHHTAVRNLNRIREGVGGAVDLGAGLNQTVQMRVDFLLQAVEAKSKTLSWRLRAKVGERLQWWEDVDEREATY